MAGVFSKDQQEQLRNLGSGIGAILTQRYQSTEAQKFSDTEFARFNAETAAFNESLGTFQDPNSDEMANAFKQYQSNILMPFITKTSMKYADNPQVMQVVQQVKEANDKGFDQFMDFGKLNVQQRGVGVQENQEARLDEQQTNDEARKAEMHPLEKEQTQAQTGLLKSQANYYDRMPTGGKSNKEAEPKTFEDVLKAERSSKNFGEKQKLDQRTVGDVVSRIVTKNNGKLYPSKTGVWGSDPDKNQAEALNYLRQKDLLQDVYTAGRVAMRLGKNEKTARQLYDHGFSPEALALVFPDLPIMGEPDGAVMGARGKIDDKVSDQDVVSVVTGTPQSAAFNFSNLDEFFDEGISRMKSYNDLPPQLRQIFEIVKSDKLGNPIVQAGDSETGTIRDIPLTQLRSTKENDISFKSALESAAQTMIINPSVEPGTQKAKQVEEFIDKVIEKFLPEIGVEKSPALREQLSLQPEGMMDMIKKMGAEIDFPRAIKDPISLIKKGSKKTLGLLYNKTEKNAGS